MLIENFGLFWDRDAVAWQPGKGRTRRLWARRGTNLPGLRVADMWAQHGLYVLYSYTGPYYVGIARKQHLGQRLAQHTRDDHRNAWVRFSWFGFLPVTDDVGELAVPIGDADGETYTSRDDIIADMEALLIKSMGTYNLNNMNFRAAREWTQVGDAEADRWLRKLD